MAAATIEVQIWMSGGPSSRTREKEPPDPGENGDDSDGLWSMVKQSLRGYRFAGAIYEIFPLTEPPDSSEAWSRFGVESRRLSAHYHILWLMLI
jgi:hypothetical protein